ncbi:MAG TPA: glycogen/starch/alpha-glucan phosphorylase, partial [Steroidobacteraceae bacterium]|nr:glycogen/starch/alpha-glucan phosphorylase [Steroidobacteraceae bacterium]
TFRRWLHQANPGLTKVLVDAIGDAVLDDAMAIEKLVALKDDAALQSNLAAVRKANKAALARLVTERLGIIINPDALFDVHIKRIHEYKRQLLNALRIVVLYNRLRENPTLEMAPRTFFFAGKAAPAYRLAKLVIKFIHSLAATIDGDPAIRGRLKVLFLPEYDVSLAQRIIPASDVSNQISTAGYEASGTSNMKFMINGALTLGTRDGATIEMAQEAGEKNLFLFGLTAAQVVGSREWYNPRWHYDHEPETRAALDLIRSSHFDGSEPEVFAPLFDTLLTHGDHYMHLADLRSYLDADERVRKLYANPDDWALMAILNIAAAGKFSSDRAIAEYSAQIWKAKPCPVM